MKLYNSIGPNPKVVRMFMAERGIELPKIEIDMPGGENRKPAYLAKNPSGQTPALELDDGTVIAEITVICEYLDEIAPGPSLVGATPEERAVTRMWVRRMDLNVVEPGLAAFRNGPAFPAFKDRVRCIPHAAEDFKLMLGERLAWLDGLMAGRTHVCGERFSLADVFLFGFVEFFSSVGQGPDASLGNIGAWFERMKARPSAAA